MASGLLLFFLLVVVLAVVGLVWLLIRSRGSGGRRSDGMTSFQRQIDALSPEARRPVVDQVKRAATDDDDDESGRRRQAR